MEVAEDTQEVTIALQANFLLSAAIRFGRVPSAISCLTLSLCLLQGSISLTSTDGCILPYKVRPATLFKAHLPIALPLRLPLETDKQPLLIEDIVVADPSAQLHNNSPFVHAKRHARVV